MRGEYDNLLRWNGHEWQFYQIPPNGYIRSIFVINPWDIWMVDGRSIIHYDGLNFTERWRSGETPHELRDLKTIWGSSSSDVYFAGDEGILIHFNGTDFQEIDTGFMTDFGSISGTEDGAYTFLVGKAGWDYGDGYLLMSQGNPNTWEEMRLPEDLAHAAIIENPHWQSCGVRNYSLIVSGVYGLWEYDIDSQESLFTHEDSIPYGHGTYKDVIKVSEHDILLAGKWMYYLHFNGARYSHVNEIRDQFPFAIMGGAAYKDDLVVMAGSYGAWLASQALIARGYRLAVDSSTR